MVFSPVLLRYLFLLWIYIVALLHGWSGQREMTNASRDSCGGGKKRSLGLPPLLQRFQCSVAPVSSSKQDDMTSLTSNGPENCPKLGVPEGPGCRRGEVVRGTSKNDQSALKKKTREEQRKIPKLNMNNSNAWL